jgi:hypothetical protein
MSGLLSVRQSLHAEEALCAAAEAPHCERVPVRRSCSRLQQQQRTLYAAQCTFMCDNTVALTCYFFLHLLLPWNA